MGLRRVYGMTGLVAACASAWALSPPPADSPLDGFWLSDGYGLSAEIRDGRMQVFEITSISCIPADTLLSKSGPDDAHRYLFAADDRSDPILLSPGPATDSLWVYKPGTASSISLKRTVAPPKTCAAKTPNDPETNFEVFWRTFGAHHGFLKHRGVDWAWAAAYQMYRSRVGPSTKPDDLFDILTAMIEPLHDAHTSLRAPELKRTFRGKKPGTLAFTQAEKHQTVDIIQEHYVKEPLRSWCNGHVRYARLSKAAGYLRIDTFSGYKGRGGGSGPAYRQALYGFRQARAERCR